MPTTTALAEYQPFVLPAPIDNGFDADDLADDLEGLELRFPRVKIPGGGVPQFKMPGEDPDHPEYIGEIEGMAREISKDYRADQRRRRAEPQYLESIQSVAFDICREAESSLILHELFTSATSEQYQLARMRVEGFSLKGAAKSLGLQTRQAHKLLTDLRQVYTCLHI